MWKILSNLTNSTQEYVSTTLEQLCVVNESITNNAIIKTGVEEIQVIRIYGLNV